MKRFVKYTSLVLLICLVFVGCSNEKNAKQTNVSKEYQKSWVTDKPKEYTIFQYNTKPFDDDYEIFKKAAEMTNVTLKGYLSKSVTEPSQAFNLMMASGDIADIICYNSKADFTKYGANGAFIPLNDLIDKYGPDIKKTFDEVPEARKAATSLEGKLYYIPYIPDGDISQVWYMRQDWLDKLGLQRPKTTDEFYNVLKAFRERDPNGNGKKDEIPFFSNGGKDSFNTALPLWGANCWWIVDQNGKIRYGPAEESYKTAFIDLAKWYREGLIDSEIYTRGGTSISKLLSDNLGGCTHAWVGSTATYNDTLKDAIPGFNWRVIAPPGEKGSETRGKVVETGWGISSNVKDPETIIKYFNFWHTEEGRRLANFGLEGVQYDMIDGKPIFKPEVLTNGTPVITQLSGLGAQMRLGYRQDFAYETQMLNPIALEGIKDYMDNDYCLKGTPKFARTAEEEKEYTVIQGVISSYVEETSQKWVMGMEDPATSFDSFVKKLKSLKLDRLIEIQQAAYDRFMAQ